jgi:hypothetical protein
MKRSLVLFFAVLVVFVMAGGFSSPASAADFSGKWINYKLASEGEEVNFEEMGVPKESLGYIEFKDEIAYYLDTGAEEVIEMPCKADGDKLIPKLPDEMAEVFKSPELYFEGGELIFEFKADDAGVKKFYKKAN